MKTIFRVLIAQILVISLLLSVFATGDSKADSIKSEKDIIAATAEAWLKLYTENVFLYANHDLTQFTVAELPLAQRESIRFQAQAYQPRTRTAELLSTKSATDNIDYYLQKAEFFTEARQYQGIKREQFETRYSVEVVSVVGNSASVSASVQKTFYYTGEEMQSFLAEDFDVHLVKVNDSWLVFDITADDCFDAEHKGTGFTAKESLLQFKQSYDAAKSIPISTFSIGESDINMELEGAVSPNSATLYTRRPYSRTNAINYAYTYTCLLDGKYAAPENYNTNFNCYNRYYGYDGNVDCMNFASQCIYAGFHGSNVEAVIDSGSFPQDSDGVDSSGKWLATSGSTYSWATVTGFHSYATSQESTNAIRMETIVSESYASNTTSFDANQNYLGGIALVSNMGHAIVITRQTSASKSGLYYTAHTSDAKNVRMSDSYLGSTVTFIIPTYMVDVKTCSGSYHSYSSLISGSYDTVCNLCGYCRMYAYNNLQNIVSAGSTITLTGGTNTTCFRMAMSVQRKGDSTVYWLGEVTDTNTYSKTFTFDQPGLYIITLHARDSNPDFYSGSHYVSHTYTIRCVG